MLGAHLSVLSPRSCAQAQLPRLLHFDPQLWIEAEQDGGDAVAAEHRVYSLILELAMEIQSDFHYVGYLFFVLMGLLKKCKPCMWEGADRVNLLEHYATWAVASAVSECAVDGVVCWPQNRPAEHGDLLGAGLLVRARMATRHAIPRRGSENDTG